MENTPEVAVLRLGHRPSRDERMTTHVGLTARALGADRVILPTIASEAVSTVEEVTDRFGGPFTVETAASPERILRDWDGRIAHLTMYGEPIQATLPAVRDAHTTPMLVVVGAAKVAVDVYDHATWNIAITNQPHSEVAALALFLDRLFDGSQFDREWKHASQRVVPQSAGKHVEEVE